MISCAHSHPTCGKHILCRQLYSDLSDSLTLLLLQSLPAVDSSSSASSSHSESFVISLSDTLTKSHLVLDVTNNISFLFLLDSHRKCRLSPLANSRSGRDRRMSRYRRGNKSRQLTCAGGVKDSKTEGAGGKGEEGVCGSRAGHRQYHVCVQLCSGVCFANECIERCVEIFECCVYRDCSGCNTEHARAASHHT